MAQGLVRVAPIYSERAARGLAGIGVGPAAISQTPQAEHTGSIGAGGGNRTHDLGIMRPSLYH